MLLCTIRHLTQLVCPCNAVMHSFVSRFHARMVLSPLPEYNMLLCTIRQYTAPVCPCNVAIGVPDGSPNPNPNPNPSLTLTLTLYHTYMIMTIPSLHPPLVELYIWG